VAFRSAGWRRGSAETAAEIAAGAAARRPLLIASAAWLAALVAIGIIVRANVANPLLLRMVDLDVYRNGGLSILRGGALYSMRSHDSLLFTYPPAAAILAVPLALVSWHTAMLAWLPMVYVPLAVVIWFAFRPLLARAGRYAPAVFAGLFGCCACLMPLRQETHYGQIDIFLVALCVLDCAVTHPRWPRGAAIGLATAIKLVPGVFIVYLLITGHRKAAGVAALTFAAASGLAVVIAPRDSAVYWSGTIFDSRRLGPNAQAANQSLRGMIMRIFFPSAAPAALWLAVALVVAVAGFAAARAVQARGQELGGVAITGMLAALLSPVAWIHHLCWIVVALGVIIGDGRSRRRVLTAVATAAVFTSILPLWGKQLYLSQAVPVALSRFLEDAFGLAALAIIVIIYRLRTAGAAGGGAAAGPPRAESGDRGSVAEGKVLAGSRER
jgi:alpha-1,2-mannosyltransferase